jgi:hypothetical protein
MKKRKYGDSNYNLRSLFKYAFELFFVSSTSPMKLITRLGGFGLFVSSVLSCLTFLNYLRGGSQVPGYTSLVLYISFVFSVLLTIQGLIGQFIIRLMSSKLRENTIWVRNQVWKLNFLWICKPQIKSPKTSLVKPRKFVHLGRETGDCIQLAFYPAISTEIIRRSLKEWNTTRRWTIFQERWRLDSRKILRFKFTISSLVYFCLGTFPNVTRSWPWRW